MLARFPRASTAGAAVLATVGVASIGAPATAKKPRFPASFSGTVTITETPPDDKRPPPTSCVDETTGEHLDQCYWEYNVLRQTEFAPAKFLRVRAIPATSR